MSPASFKGLSDTLQRLVDYSKRLEVEAREMFGLKHPIQFEVLALKEALLKVHNTVETAKKIQNQNGTRNLHHSIDSTGAKLMTKVPPLPPRRTLNPSNPLHPSSGAFDRVVHRVRQTSLADYVPDLYECAQQRTARAPQTLLPRNSTAATAAATAKNTNGSNTGGANVRVSLALQEFLSESAMGTFDDAFAQEAECERELVQRPGSTMVFVPGRPAESVTLPPLTLPMQKVVERSEESLVTSESCDAEENASEECGSVSDDSLGESATESDLSDGESSSDGGDTGRGERSAECRPDKPVDAIELFTACLHRRFSSKAKVARTTGPGPGLPFTTAQQQLNQPSQPQKHRRRRRRSSEKCVPKSSSASFVRSIHTAKSSATTTSAPNTTATAATTLNSAAMSARSSNCDGNVDVLPKPDLTAHPATHPVTSAVRIQCPPHRCRRSTHETPPLQSRAFERSAAVRKPALPLPVHDDSSAASTKVFGLNPGVSPRSLLSDDFRLRAHIGPATVAAWTVEQSSHTMSPAGALDPWGTPRSTAVQDMGGALAETVKARRRRMPPRSRKTVYQ